MLVHGWSVHLLLLHVWIELLSSSSCSVVWLSHWSLASSLAINSFLFSLHSVSLQEVGQLSVIHRGGSGDIRVSLQNLKGVLQHFDDARQSLSSLLNLLWLTKGIEDGLVLVDLHVKL